MNREEFEREYLAPPFELKQDVFNRLLEAYPGVYTYKGRPDDLVVYNLPVVYPQLFLEGSNINMYVPFHFEHYEIVLEQPITYD